MGSRPVLHIYQPGSLWQTILIHQLLICAPQIQQQETDDKGITSVLSNLTGILE